MATIWSRSAVTAKARAMGTHHARIRSGVEIIKMGLGFHKHFRPVVHQPSLKWPYISSSFNRADASRASIIDSVAALN